MSKKRDKSTKDSKDKKDSNDTKHCKSKNVNGKKRGPLQDTTKNIGQEEGVKAT